MNNAVGSWADGPCWYASVIDAEKTGLLLGPFRTEEAARKWAYGSPEDGGERGKHNAMRSIAEKCDCRAVFYSFGMVKMPNGYRAGVLNDLVERENSVDYYGR